jgi:hypothetical protein
MRTTRQFRRVTFGRRLDVQQLQAALSRTMVEMAKDPAPEGAPVRMEGVIVEPQQTTVYLSGNGPGLDAVARAARRSFTDAKVSKARRADARRPPQGPGIATTGKANRRPGKR